MAVDQVSILEVKRYTPDLVSPLYSLALQLDPRVQPKSSYRSSLQKIISHPEAHLFVAKTETFQIVGMLTLVTYPHLVSTTKTWIEDFVVDSNHRGLGIGKKLIQAAIDKVKKDGLAEINLTSNPARVAANRLYQKLGFQIHPTNYYRINLTSIAT